MKWIGQHIWDFVSRFRSVVFLEDLSTTTESNILVADSDGKVSKRAMSSLTPGSVTVADSSATTSFPIVFHNESNGLLDDTGTFTYNPGIGTMALSHGGFANFVLDNIQTNTTGPQINLINGRGGGAGDANDNTGKIIFKGQNSNSETVSFAAIVGGIENVTDTDEAGVLYIQVNASNDSTSTVRQALTATGHGTLNKVDIGLGYGATSLTTIAGDLDIDGDAITTAGAITLDSAGDIDLDSATGIVKIVESGTTFASFLPPSIFKLESASSASPEIQLINSHVNEYSPGLVFKKIATGADDDSLGRIQFQGDDEGDGEHHYAIIEGYIADATPGQESGRLELRVADHDNTMTTGLKLDGDHANGEVDVTVGAGAASDTTIAGNLTVTSDLTVSGTTTTINTTNLNVEDKNITLNYNDSSDTSGTADGAGITIQDAVDASNDATLTWTAADDTFEFSHAVEINNGASGGTSALIIDNDDVDQIALDIDAENTTANIIDIDAQDLTTGSAIFIDSHSAGDKDLINLDLDIPGAANNEYTRGLFMDIDKTGNVATGEVSYIHGVDVDFRDGGTNVGTSVFRGLYVKSVDVNDNGGNSRYGIHLSLTGGDANTTYGIRSKVENGGYDLSLESSASLSDWCRISTTTAGLTTIATQDGGSGGGGGTDAHLLLDPDGDVILNPHTAKDVYFKENGTERIQWHLDSSPTMEVTGAFDIDGSSDVSFDSASGNFKFKQSGNNWGSFDYNTTTNNSDVNIGSGASSGGNATVRTTKGTGDFNGKSLNIKGGDALDGTANNRTGGHVFIKGGQGTGSGRTGEIYFQIKEGGGSGSSAVEPEDAARIHVETSGTTRNVFSVFEPGNDSDEYCRITVEDSGVSVIETYDDSGSNGADLTLNADGRISLDAHTAKDIFFKENGTERFQFHLDSTPTMEVTGNFDINGSGDIDIDGDGDISLTAAGNDINATADNFNILANSGGFNPNLNITCTDTTSTKCAMINLIKDAADTEDNEALGSINFKGEDEGNNMHAFGTISGKIVESDEGDEAGQIAITVANNGLGRNGITMSGDKGTAGEVDVTIADGAASLTTIAGNLTVTGSKIYDFHATTFENQYSDDSGSGKIIKYSPGSSGSLDGSTCYYLHTDGTWVQVRCDSVNNGGSQLLGIGLGGDPQTVGVFIEGFIRIASTEILNLPAGGAVDGLPIYVGAIAGHFDFNPPTTSTHYVRVVGYAIDDDGGDVLIYFNPDKTWVKLA